MTILNQKQNHQPFPIRGIKGSHDFLFLLENICCGYSMEASHGDASIEYPQQMDSSRNKKILVFLS